MSIFLGNNLGCYNMSMLWETVTDLRMDEPPSGCSWSDVLGVSTTKIKLIRVKDSVVDFTG